MREDRGVGLIQAAKNKACGVPSHSKAPKERNLTTP